MGTQTDNAFEVPQAGIILNESAGLFVAITGNPWVDAPDAPVGSLFLRTDGSQYTKFQNTGSGVEGDWIFHPKEGSADRVKWRNLWQAGTYNLNEMVRDGDWTMIANTTTTDRPAPVTEGEPEFALEDSPSWATASESTPRITGARFTITDEIVLIEAIRIWVENTDADTEYFFQLVDVTDSSNEKVLFDGSIDNAVQGWVEVDIGSLLLTSGQTFDLRSFQLKQTPASEFTHPWDSDIPDDVGGDPGSGNWSRDSFFTTIRINETDSGVVDRSADLATLGAGDKIEINETGSTRRVEHYTIVSAVDQGAWVEYTVTLDYVDQAIRDNKGCDIHGENTGAPANVDIPSLANEWLNVADVDGFNVTDVTTIAASLDDNAYGVDIKFAELVASPDWDLVAFSGSLQTSGGGTGGGVTVEDEGTPLATVADTLNFAGAGVTASGSGTTKLITIPGGGTPGDQAGVQARRTTDLLFTTAFVDVPFDATDFENDAAVIEHDAITDRITLKEAGPYWVFYRVDADVDPVASSGFHAFVEARVRANDAGGALPGSLCASDTMEDGSLLGDQTVSAVLTGGFIYNASANDFLTLQIQKTESDAGGAINAAADRTMFAAIRMSGETGPQGAPGSGGSTIRVGKTYAIAGEIKVPVGQTDFIIPFFVSLAGGQTADLVKARHQIQSGTSVTCKLQKNAVDITGFTGISVTTTPADTDPTDVALAENDELALVVTAVAGTPQNLTFTIFIEHTG